MKKMFFAMAVTCFVFNGSVMGMEIACKLPSALAKTTFWQSLQQGAAGSYSPIIMVGATLAAFTNPAATILAKCCTAVTFTGGTSITAGILGGLSSFKTLDVNTKSYVKRALAIGAKVTVATTVLAGTYLIAQKTGADTMLSDYFSKK